MAREMGIRGRSRVFPGKLYEDFDLRVAPGLKQPCNMGKVILVIVFIDVCPMRIFVLLVNANTDNEGIHSINMGNRDIILMFEEEDDALRYAMLLEAQDFPALLNVEALDREEIEEFCEASGYSSYFIPQDFRPANDFERLLLSPPERNREMTDWEQANAKGNAPDGEDSMSNDELDRIRRKLEGLL
jgi:hypothetical protein